MAKQWRIRFKRQVQGYDADEDENYPAIGRAVPHLDLLANVQGWKPLSQFVSEDPEAAIDLLDDEEEIEELLGYLPDDDDLMKALKKKLGKVRWYKPEEALPTVQQLCDAIEEMPRRLSYSPQNTARVVKELKVLRQTLERLKEKGVPFRFYHEFG
ncbi:MAG: hypothetical protein QM703_10445 [Gemmatales bacterium]